jgi:hypothetical protein
MDVHFDGIFNRTVKDQYGKILYVRDHEVKTSTIIAWSEDVNMMVKNVPWSFLGQSFEGTTDALIFEIEKSKIVCPVAKEIVENKRPIQNSVRMQYVTIKLGMNSNAKEDIQYKEYYDANIAKIVNKQDVIDAGDLFFGVEEAKIVIEGSMVVRGSNQVTPIRQKDAVAADSTHEHNQSAADSTDETETKFINFNLI